MVLHELWQETTLSDAYGNRTRVEGVWKSYVLH